VPSEILHVVPDLLHGEVVFDDPQPGVADAPPAFELPPVLAAPPGLVAPPVAFDPAVLEMPPVAFAPPVAAVPPVAPPVVGEPPVAGLPPVATAPPLALAPPVDAVLPKGDCPPVGLAPPVVGAPLVFEAPPVLAPLALVVVPPWATEPPTVGAPLLIAPPVSAPPLEVLPPEFGATVMPAPEQPNTVVNSTPVLSVRPLWLKQTVDIVRPPQSQCCCHNAGRGSDKFDATMLALPFTRCAGTHVLWIASIQTSLMQGGRGSTNRKYQWCGSTVAVAFLYGWQSVKPQDRTIFVHRK